MPQHRFQFSKLSLVLEKLLPAENHIGGHLVVLSTLCSHGFSHPATHTPQQAAAQEKSFRECFAFFDKVWNTIHAHSPQDGDGQILTTELGQLMSWLGQYPSDSELQSVVREVALDEKVDIAGFLRVMGVYERIHDYGAEQEEIREAFKVFDKDGDGSLSLAELRHDLTNLGEVLTEEEVDHLVVEADTNQDGHLSFEEFHKMMGSKQM